MRYVAGESIALVGKFATGATITITITKLSDGSEDVSAAACSEIGSTGYFQYDFEPPAGYDEYLWVMTDGIDEVSGSFVVDGWPDENNPSVEEIRAEMDSHSTKLTHLDADISSRLAADDYTEPPTEGEINTKLVEEHGDGAWGSGVGLQLKEYTLTLDGDPVAGVSCWVTSDAAGLIRISPVRATNSLGKVVFQLDLPVGTTVYVWHLGATVGDEEVV
jgi:hypothetical protein